MFKGVFTAIVTPFHKGELDEESLRSFIEFQIENGISGLVPCGTTGESPTLSHAEYVRTVRITVETVRQRVPVIAGAGANSTAKAIALSEEVGKLGVDATLQVAPYYNKPSQEGLYQHYKAIADVGVPIMVYNVPGRTGINITPHTMERLSKLPAIVALKDACGDLSQTFANLQLCGSDISLLSGDDALTLPMMRLGGSGVVSVISNLMPAKMVALCSCMDSGDIAGAEAIHAYLSPLMETMFVEPNPIPVKTALMEKGLIKSAEIRLPLTAMTETNRDTLVHVMKESEA